MRFVFAQACVLLLFAGPASAQLTDADPCPEAHGALERGNCAWAAYERADAELNAVWKRALAEFPSGGADRAAHREEIRASQRAWIKYRDLDCEAISQIGTPNYWGMNKAYCLWAHTVERTRLLRRVYVGD